MAVKFDNLSRREVAGLIIALCALLVMVINITVVMKTSSVLEDIHLPILLRTGLQNPP